MPEKNKEMLTALMKKQISEKSSKKNSAPKSVNPSQSSANGEQKEGENKGENEEEMSEEEQVEEAKKASKGKSAQYDQTEMIKRLILESGLKYTVIIGVLVLFAIGVIKFGPAVLAFFNGLLYKILMGALGK